MKPSFRPEKECIWLGLTEKRRSVSLRSGWCTEEKRCLVGPGCRPEGERV